MNKNMKNTDNSDKASVYLHFRHLSEVTGLEISQTHVFKSSLQFSNQQTQHIFRSTRFFPR